MNRRLHYGLLSLLVATLACRPVLAISGSEVLIIGSLIAVLLGPPLYRWIRRVDEFFKDREKNK